MTVKNLDDFLKDLDEIEKIIQKLFDKTIEKTKLSNIELIVRQAEWHLRGCIYHCRNIIKYYRKIQVLDIISPPDVIYDMYSKQLILPTSIIKVDVIRTSSRSIKKLMFEFHALVNLARISLDNLRNILAPLFKTPYQNHQNQSQHIKRALQIVHYMRKLLMIQPLII